jgi:hypothetical protein
MRSIEPGQRIASSLQRKIASQFFLSRAPRNNGQKRATHSAAEAARRAETRLVRSTKQIGGPHRQKILRVLRVLTTGRVMGVTVMRPS